MDIVQHKNYKICLKTKKNQSGKKINIDEFNLIKIEKYNLDSKPTGYGDYSNRERIAFTSNRAVAMVTSFKNRFLSIII